MLVNRDSLKSVLESVAPALSDKDPTGQADCFIFSNGRVWSYNDELCISAPFELPTETMAVKGELLLEFVAKAPSEEIEVSPGELELLVSSGRARAGIALQRHISAPIDYIISGQSKGEWEGLPADFREGLAFCTPYAAKEVSRPALTCLHVTSDYVEASDHFQIVRYCWNASSKLPEMLLPAKSAEVLMDYEVEEFLLADGWAHFRAGNGVVVSVRTMDRQYPDCSPFVSVQGVRLALPPRLADSLDKASAFAKKRLVPDVAPSILVEISSRKLKIRAENEHGWLEETMALSSPVEGVVTFHISIDRFREAASKGAECYLSDRLVLFRSDRWSHAIAIWGQQR